MREKMERMQKEMEELIAYVQERMEQRPRRLRRV